MTDPFLEAIENLLRFLHEQLVRDSAGLVQDNERRWRVFRERVVPLVHADAGTHGGQA